MQNPMNWRVMETAPRDETDILVSDKNGHVWCVRYVGAVKGEYDEWMAQACATSDAVVMCFATEELNAWMPMPQPYHAASAV